MGAREIHVVAPFGVEGGSVVFHQRPCCAVKDHAALIVPEESAVGDGDVPRLIFIIRGIHAGVDRLIEVAELQIFNVDVTAVDPDPDTVPCNTDLFLLNGGEVNEKTLFCPIKEKGSGIFPHQFFVGKSLKFNA